MCDVGDLDAYLDRTRTAFEERVSVAVELSGRAAGRQVANQLAWSTWLFARVVSISINIEKLVRPGPRDGAGANSLDFACVGSLCRDLIEASFTFLYLSETVAEDVWLMREKLVQLHDSIARQNLFTALDEAEQSEAAHHAREEISGDLRALPQFQALPRGVRDKVLVGRRLRTMSNADVARTHGLDEQHFHAMYGLLSSNLHSSPLSWLRMWEQGSIPGRRADKDKGYTALSFEYATGVLDIAIARMEEVLARLPEPGLAER